MRLHSWWQCEKFHGPTILPILVEKYSNKQANKTKTLQSNLSKGIEQICLKWYNLIRAEKIDLLWIKLCFSYFILLAQFDGNSICGGNRWKDAAGSPVIG